MIILYYFDTTQLIQSFFLYQIEHSNANLILK